VYRSVKLWEWHVNASCHRALASSRGIDAGTEGDSAVNSGEGSLLETVLCSKLHMQYLQSNLEMHRGFTTLSLTLG
jgi:hypothetical protein